MVEAKVVKFCAKLAISIVRLGITNRPWKGRGQGHLVTWPSLEFYIPWNIFGTAKDTDYEFCARFGNEKCQPSDDQLSPK